MIISTGTADLAEVEETVRVVREAGNDDIVLMQCTGAYPAPPESVNVRAMEALRNATGMPVGLICKDVNIAVDSAAALGAYAPMAKETARLWEEARDRFGFDPDQSEVVRLWETETDVTVSHD